MVNFLFWVFSTILLIYYINKLVKELYLFLLDYIFRIAKKRGKVVEKTVEYTVHEVSIMGVVCKVKVWNNV